MSVRALVLGCPFLCSLSIPGGGDGQTRAANPAGLSQPRFWTRVIPYVQSQGPTPSSLKGGKGEAGSAKRKAQSGKREAESLVPS